MKRFLYIFGALGLLVVSGIFLVQVPVVQDQLMQREISQRMS